VIEEIPPTERAIRRQDPYLLSGRARYTVRAPRARVKSCKVVLNRRRMSSDAIRS